MLSQQRPKPELAATLSSLVVRWRNAVTSKNKDAALDVSREAMVIYQSDFAGKAHSDRRPLTPKAH